MKNLLASLKENDPVKRNALKAAHYNALGLSVLIIFVGLAYLIPSNYLPVGSLLIIAGLLLIISSAIIEIKNYNRYLS